MISPTVLNTPYGTQDIPSLLSWDPPTVLNTPHSTQDIPWDPPTVLNTPHGTHDIPPRYWTPPTVLSTPHGTAHTLYRVYILWLSKNLVYNVYVNLSVRHLDYVIDKRTDKRRVYSTGLQGQVWQKIQVSQGKIFSAFCSHNNSPDRGIIKIYLHQHLYLMLTSK